MDLKIVKSHDTSLGTIDVNTEKPSGMFHKEPE
jgi:hypothetical protein